MRSTSKGLIAGIDIGGSKIETILLDENTREYGRGRSKTRTSDANAMISGIVELLDGVLESATLHKTDLQAVGVGVPGQVDPRTGEVSNAVNLKLNRFPLKQRLEEQINVPVLIENDVKLAALGAYHKLFHPNAISTMAYLSIGTGIAVAVVIDGELYRGSNGLAGEIGHIVVQENGPRCGCGQAGCLEALVAGPAIVERAKAVGLPVDAHSAKAVFRMSEQGDKRAKEVAQFVAHYLARAIQWIVMAYDVEKIVIGGGVANAQTPLLNAIFRELAELRTHSRLNRMMLLDEKIQIIPTGFNAGTQGAVYLAQQLLPDTFR